MSDKKVKLTPAQVEVLRELVKPGAYAFLYVDLQARRWIIGGKKRTAPIVALFLKSFALVSGYDEKGRRKATITESGRAYLASLEKDK